MKILTQVKKYLKKVDRFLTVPKFYGPLSTAAFTVLYHLGHLYFGYSITVSWLWLAMIFGSFVGGLRAGLISAAWIVLYSIYAFWNDDPGRIVQIGLTTFLAAAVVGWQTRKLKQVIEEKTIALLLAKTNQAKADLVDSANGNVDKLRTALKMLDDLLAGWAVLSDDARRNLVIETKAHLATLTTLVLGWRKLAQERRYAEGKEGDE